MRYNIILQLSPQFLLRMLLSTRSKTAGPFVQKVDNYINNQKLCYTAYAEQPFALSFSIQPFDQWGFRQNLDGDDEEAFLSIAKKLDRRSEQLKVNK